MLDDNAIPALLHLLSANVEDKVTMLHCIYALCNLSCVPGYEKFLMRHGVLKAATLIAKSDDDSLIEPAITILYNLTVTAGEVFDDLSEILVQDIIHLAMLQEHKEDQGESVKRYAYIFARALCNLTRLVRLRARMVTEGIIKRGCNVRLLRDNIVIHEGPLKTLKRFKDEVSDVREGLECGIALEKFNDIVVGDVFECFEVKETAAKL